MNIHSSSSSSSSSFPSDMGINKKICILVFNGDYICQNLVSEVLQNCAYEVLHIGRAMNALSAIRERKDALSLVLTNVNRSKTKGAEVIQFMEKELNLHLVYMLPGDMEFDSRGQECNVSSYIVNFSDLNDMKDLWQAALEKVKARKAAISPEENAGNCSSVGVEASVENEASVDGAIRNHHQNRKRKELEEKSEETEASGGETKKKPRLTWTPEMHHKFEEAIQKLGYDKAVPKKIVDYMNEPGLTREHVASHLQKYRSNLKKGPEYSTNFIYGQNMKDDVTRPYYRPRFSGLNFSHSQRYPFPFNRTNSSIFSASLPGKSYFSNTTTSCLTPSHRYPPSMLSSVDTMLHQQRRNQNALMELQSNFVPRAPINCNFRVYGDDTKNILLAVENGHSSDSLSINQPSSSGSGFRFNGLRVVNDEIQFGEKSSIACGEIHGESPPSMAADWISGNAGSVSSCSMPFNPSLHRQTSDLPFSQSGTSMDQCLVNCHPVPPSFTSFKSVKTSGSFISEQQVSENYSEMLVIDDQSLVNCHPVPHSFTSFESVKTSGSFVSENYSEMLVIDDQCMPQPLPGNSGNFSSKKQESSSSQVQPAVLEINSYGGEEDISAMLDETDIENPIQFWDEDFDAFIGT